ncbi:nuclear transport factor 2 family protein [Aestuariicella hydrocarbonica]|uniref:Nuclear transport factor 2 family protein n=1 Tax=Pseudomaricurvus hydrocarbonicus TaxID=1470433 RepID=A0A9E5MNG1_9GAMM|nr:nuclear transport factor 2 family protein [Aestuariicella hydrocarbonica]NHO67407.1 nuclear transport factor 2 family protein [Aestuariicella hydrocarbonica]
MTVLSFSDYLDICETKARYCRALDSKNWEEFTDVFTEDLLLDTAPAGGYTIHGRAEAISSIRSSVEAANTAHQVHSPEITFHGDSADVIWAMQDRIVWSAEQTQHKGNPGFTGYGHYHEHYVRCADGRWRIQRQQLTRLFLDVHPNREE